MSSNPGNIGVALGCCFVAGVLYAASTFAMAYCIEWAWNAFVFGVFRGPQINYWEAFALYVLASIVFGWLRPSSSLGKS